MSGLQFAGLFGSGGGGGGSAEINVAAGPLLPAIVPDRQIFVLSTEPVAAWYVSTNEPTGPVEGDVWVQLAEGQHILSFSDASPYFTVGLFRATRYDGALWQLKEGYLGVGGTWQQFARALPAPGTPMEQWTWEEIDIASGFRLARSYFQIGDTKNMLSGGIQYPLEIVGFDHDDLTDGSNKAGITFGMKHCFTTEYRINATGTNVGGWDGSEFYNVTLPTLKGTLPADLRAVVKTVKKLTSAGNKSTNIVTTNDDFFLFSEIEIFGSRTYSVAGEGGQYPLFATAATRLKRIGSATGAAAYWWQRSPHAGSATSFCDVSADGSAAAYFPDTAVGIALGFCV